MGVMWLPRVARTGATPASDVLLLKSFEMSLKYSIYEIASKKSVHLKSLWNYNARNTK
jgi:hypothetical protein